ncbi:GDP-mannose 4,6-dehydratase [Rhodococcus sp. KRD197]|uniref:GDP-mannose 4,6-dehydratase n=1 Tax=Rhodococcus sp. KRD197 TaxID=2729731 RepID=UPI001F496783|nr:GDP-mannose 4,6-dehydratase [Rhodococcus sp. KRD197]
MKRALITGITGQDGLYLSELLHDKGYKVYGLVRGQNNPKRALLEQSHPFVEILSGNLLDLSSLMRAFSAAQPDEVYNLGAVSFVAYSPAPPENAAAPALPPPTALPAAMDFPPVATAAPAIRAVPAAAAPDPPEPTAATAGTNRRIIAGRTAAAMVSMTMPNSDCWSWSMSGISPSVTFAEFCAVRNAIA